MTIPGDEGRALLRNRTSSSKVGIWLMIGVGWRSHYGGGIVFPTHWMPLPPPPVVQS